MSDAELEAHIAHAEALERAARDRWERYGCFGDAGEADLWHGIAQRARSARGPVYVARIRKERGLE